MKRDWNSQPFSLSTNSQTDQMTKLCCEFLSDGALRVYFHYVKFLFRFSLHSEVDRMSKNSKKAQYLNIK